jgi:uncharacterized phage protein gp47/JayE
LSNSRFITYPITTEPRDLMEQAFNYLELKIPGWQAAEGNLDVWMIEAFAGEAADVATIATQVPKSIFRFFGQQLFGIPSIEASAAVVETTWYAMDAVGYTIIAGTQFGVRDSSGDLHVFVVTNDVAIPTGKSSTDPGQVVGVATIPGASASGIGTANGQVELIDPLVWMDHITQIDKTNGGQDAESDDDYLDRLALELQTISPRPILPRDFSILARNIPGVQRATTLDLYNPANGTSNNERMVTVISLDEAGAAVSTPIRNQVQTYLDSMREINFIVNTMDVFVRSIDVTTSITVLPGYSAADTASRVTSAIQYFLNPALWGMDPNDNKNDPKTWINKSTIYYLEMSTAINNVGGVDRIVSLTLGLHNGPQAPQDYVMQGVVTIPNPGTILVTTV